MFNLIVAVLSIALIGVTAGASVYYGGSAFSSNASKGVAAALVQSGSQISAAQQLAMVQRGGSPLTTVDALVTEGYLSTPPNIPKEVLGNFTGDAPPRWQIDAAGTVAALELSHFAPAGTAARNAAELLCQNIADGAAGGDTLDVTGTPAATTRSNNGALSYGYATPSGILLVGTPGEELIAVASGTNGCLRYTAAGTDLAYWFFQKL